MLGDGRRIVDFAIAGQVSRRIGSDTALGSIAAAQVFEVTGEGARDIVVSIPSASSNTGRVYFTLSPKLRLSRSSVAMAVKRGSGSVATSIGVLNPTPLQITWEATSNSTWLRLAPGTGSADDANPATVTFTASAIGLNPGTYTAAVTVRSTSPDLTMSLPVSVTFSVTDTIIQLDGPAHGSTTSQPFNIGGWAFDFGSTSGSGVDAIHVWAWPTDGSSPTFIGVGNSDGLRTDVGAIYGSQFNNSGFNLVAMGLTPKQYQIAAYARNAKTLEFESWRVVTVTVVSSAKMSIDTPGPNAVVGSNFHLAGWAFDAASSSGTGVDAIHVWAFPQSGTPGSPRFLGTGSYGTSRPDVGAAFGARFTNSGYFLNVPGLPAGNYIVVVYAHSSVSGSFDNQKGVPLRVQ